MKNIPLIALLAGAVLLTSSKKKATASTSTSKYEKLDPKLKKENEEAIKKFYQSPPILIKDISLIYDVLVPSLKEYVTKEEVSIMIPLDKAYEVFEYAQVIIMQDYKSQKEIADNANLVDDITKKVLETLMSDVYWKEKILPYQFGSMFHVVWTSATELVKLGAKNLEETKKKP